jgi:HSP20 family protein
LDRLKRLTELVDEVSDLRPYRGMEDCDRWCPSVDTYETVAGLVLLVELPGVSPDAISLTVEGQTLTLSGNRPDPMAEHKLRLHRMEIDHGPFERKILLPEGMDADAIEASYREGFLRVLIPRHQKPEGGSIPIQEG